MKKLVGLVLSVLVLGSIAHASQPALAAKPAFASDVEMKNYLSIASESIEETSTAAPTQYSPFAATTGVPTSLALGNDFLATLGPVLADPSGISGWIAFGQKAWEVVVANKPILNLQTQRVTILPENRGAWMQMAGWRGPATKTFTFTAKNLYGIEVVKQTYTVAFNYGGSMGGKGAYIANATIIPDVSVAWGYTLDSKVDVGQIVNMGTVESPIPGVELQLTRSIKTIFKEKKTVDSFFVRGDGNLHSVTHN